MPQDQNHKYDVYDLLTYALDQKPLEFQAAFTQIMGDRTLDALDDARAEIAQSLFGAPEVDDVENEDSIDQFDPEEGQEVASDENSEI